MSFLLGIVLQVSVWTFAGDNTWTPKEWRQMFRTVQEFYRERLDVKIKIVSWRNSKSRCKRWFKYETEKEYGNCLYRREVKPYRGKSGFTVPALLFTGPIPLGHGDTGVGGLASEVCAPEDGVALVHGKHISTHYFSDGGNAGWELTRLAVIHELGHIYGARHTDDYGPGDGIDVMNSNALFLLYEEFQVQTDGVWENFRDVLPLAKYSQKEVTKCLH